MATSLPVWPEVVDAMTLDQYESWVAQERRELAWRPAGAVSPRHDRAFEA
jgi:hypothetical protein